MTTWFLVTFLYGLHWSPAMPSQAECERVRSVLIKYVKEHSSGNTNYLYLCVEVRMK